MWHEEIPKERHIIRLLWIWIRYFAKGLCCKNKKLISYMNLKKCNWNFEFRFLLFGAYSNNTFFCKNNTIDKDKFILNFNGFLGFGGYSFPFSSIHSSERMMISGNVWKEKVMNLLASVLSTRKCAICTGNKKFQLFLTLLEQHFFSYLFSNSKIWVRFIFGS